MCSAWRTPSALSALLARRKQGNLSAAQAAAQWPLVEAVGPAAHAGRLPVLLCTESQPRAVCAQAATHYNLSLVSPAPARCTSYDCAGDVPFTWCAACAAPAHCAQGCRTCMLLSSARAAGGRQVG